MKTINTQFQQNTVEDLNKNYLNETEESYKLKTLEILNNENTSFSEFTKEQSIATDISRRIGAREGAMLKQQIKFLLDKQKNKAKPREAANNPRFTGAPNLEPKILGGVA